MLTVLDRPVDHNKPRQEKFLELVYVIFDRVETEDTPAEFFGRSSGKVSGRGSPVRNLHPPA